MSVSGMDKTAEAIEFGHWLSRQRKARDLTQEELAERIGCSVWSIQKFEVGNRRPSKQVAEMLAAFFQVPPAERDPFMRFARGREDEGRWARIEESEGTKDESNLLIRPSTTIKFEPASTVLESGKSKVERPNNLPVQLTSFVGRAIEVPRVRDLMLTSDVRLLTLTGPPGTGKTRLALQAAAELLRDFEDRVFFVNLAPITDPDLVISEIAQTLGVGESGGTSLAEGIEAYLKDKRLLLVLDNFEQVVDAGTVAGQLLMTAPGLKMLVTSRVPLHVRGEKEFAVPPLHLPDMQHLPPVERIGRYEAVRLFMERAADVSAGFKLTDENAATVAQICTRLDGLPLAIELAAARVKVLPPEAILSRLERRLELLTGGARDLPVRQRTLRAAIEWSYDLLDEDDKKLFSRLAVFRGGRSLEAIEAVCGMRNSAEFSIPHSFGVLDGVSSLVDKGLLRREEGTTGAPRFVMLETIHEFAGEKLQESGEAEEMSRAHAEYYLQFAEQAESHLTAHDQMLWLDRLDEELDNLRAVLEWSRGETGDAYLGLRLAAALWLFWQNRGYFLEGTEQILGVLHRADEDQAGLVGSAEYARALVGLGWLSLRRGNIPQLRRSAEQSLEIFEGLGDKRGIASALLLTQRICAVEGDQAMRLETARESLALYREVGDMRGVIDALFQIGTTCMMLGELAEARRTFEECLGMALDTGHKRMAGWSLENLGSIASLEDQNGESRRRWEEALSTFREIRDPLDEAMTVGNLATLAMLEGDYSAAQRLAEESVAAFQGMGARQLIASGLNLLGLVAQHMGDYPKSRELLLESIRLMRETEDLGLFDETLVGMAGIAAGQEQPGRAAALLGAAHSAMGTDQARWWPAIRKEYERVEADAKSQLSESLWQDAWQKGRAMTMEDAIACALEG